MMAFFELEEPFAASVAVVVPGLLLRSRLSEGSLGGGQAEELKGREAGRRGPLGVDQRPCFNMV